MPKITYHCRTCRGANISREASARWDQARQAWDMCSLLDVGHCDDCGGTARLVARDAESGAPMHPVMVNLYEGEVWTYGAYCTDYSRWVGYGRWAAHALGIDRTMGRRLNTFAFDLYGGIHRFDPVNPHAAERLEVEA